MGRWGFVKEIATRTMTARADFGVSRELTAVDGGIWPFLDARRMRIIQ